MIRTAISPLFAIRIRLIFIIIYYGSIYVTAISISIAIVADRFETCLYNGILPCFLAGTFTHLLFRAANAETIFFLVTAGSITSSIYPLSSAINGFATLSRYFLTSSFLSSLPDSLNWQAPFDTKLLQLRQDPSQQFQLSAMQS